MLVIIITSIPADCESMHALGNQDGSFKLSVAGRGQRLHTAHRWVLAQWKYTFEMEEHVRLVILEHLRDQLDVHVLDVDLLEALIHGQDSLI